jgi:pantoate--beta-alanine ligase/3-methyl-2-oxobutanoate hydroxymethyltransferase
MEQKRITVPELGRMKAAGERITMVTAYDWTFARLVDEGGADMILVGDSVGMVVQGHETTLPVTLDEMVYHTRLVTRGARRALVVGDLPFGAYQADRTKAVEASIRLVKEGGAQAVKLEGGLTMADTIEAIASIDVPVMGHVGLTPQSVHRMGGHRVQGRRKGSAPGGRERVIEDAKAVEAAGAFAVVLECIPLDLAAEITAALESHHRHRRRRALRWPGAGAPRPGRPQRQLDAALRQALRRARPRGRARDGGVLPRGSRGHLPERAPGLQASGAQGGVMQVLQEPRAMQAWADDARRSSGSRRPRIALVPTMGALHEGHLVLVDEARRHAERVVVSVFVNPMQFNRRDDFDRYPRPLDDDLAACRGRNVDAVYAPTAAAMYPEGFQSGVEVLKLTEPLCGAGRPGHFRGVTTVVTKLFHAVRPDVAVFGEKDFQQLAVIRRMTADLDFGIEIVGVPTVREPDGLALSSRNRLLSPAGREAAVCVPRSLDAATAAVKVGRRNAAAVLGAVQEAIDAEPMARIEYAELRDPATLDEVTEVEAPTLLALAVWVDGVRLIDNRILKAGVPS